MRRKIKFLFSFTWYISSSPSCNEIKAFELKYTAVIIVIESLPVPLAYTSLARSFMMSPNDSGINELAHIKKSASVSGVQLSSEKKNNKTGKRQHQKEGCLPCVCRNRAL